MPRRDIIAAGASAGGLGALKRLVASLPPGLEASVLVVQHLAPDAATMLPDILAQAGPLPATLAADGEPIRSGHIYVAPPDQHLIVDRGFVRLSRGPRAVAHSTGFTPVTVA